MHYRSGAQASGAKNSKELFPDHFEFSRDCIQVIILGFFYTCSHVFLFGFEPLFLIAVESLFFKNSLLTLTLGKDLN